MAEKAECIWTSRSGDNAVRKMLKSTYRRLNRKTNLVVILSSPALFYFLIRWLCHILATRKRPGSSQFCHWNSWRTRGNTNDFRFRHDRRSTLIVLLSDVGLYWITSISFILSFYSFNFLSYDIHLMWMITNSSWSGYNQHYRSFS